MPQRTWNPHKSRRKQTHGWIATSRTVKNRRRAHGRKRLAA